MDTSNYHLWISNLSVSYKSDLIINEINLKLKQGEFLSIVGKSGTGKSTLLHAIAGFIEYTGEIKAPETMGIVFQNYGLFPWMTVSENITAGLHHLAPIQRKEILASTLQMIGLVADANKYPSQLSGGQTQRVAIARTLAVNPELILMDEPFGALDMHTKDAMQNWLMNLWAQSKTTILFVTHDIEEAIFLSDRVVVLGEGNILDDIIIDLPRPRNEELKFSSHFVDIKLQIFHEMR